MLAAMFGGNGRGRRVSATMLVITAGLLASASSANASKLSATFHYAAHGIDQYFTQYTYEGAPGERNNLTLRAAPALGVPLVFPLTMVTRQVQLETFLDTGALVISAPLMVPAEGFTAAVACLSALSLVLCNDAADTTTVYAKLGDGNDRGQIEDGGRRGGPYGGGFGATWDGGPGDDVTNGGLAIAGPGADTMYNGQVDYSARTTSQSLTLDGVANDGNPGERDNLSPSTTQCSTAAAAR